MITVDVIQQYNDNNTFNVRLFRGGWSVSAMMLGKLPVPGRPTVWVIVGQGPNALAVGADGVVWIFSLSLFCLFLGDGPI